jgi:hypothetical protein
MNAVETLAAALAANVEVEVDCGDLALRAGRRPPQDVLDALADNKAAIIEFLRPDSQGWTVTSWWDFFNERAAFLEYDGGASRTEAEASAFACCVPEWLNHYPVRSGEGFCCGCGNGDRSEDPLLPFGTASLGHAWLHGACWPQWYAERIRVAKVALNNMGITPNGIATNRQVSGSSCEASSGSGVGG